MRNYLKHLNTIKPVVFGGDMNCCFKDQDLHSSTHIGAHQHQIQRERVAFSALLQETGFKDCFRHFYPRKESIVYIINYLLSYKLFILFVLFILFY